MTILFGLRDILGAVDRHIAVLASSIEGTRDQRARRGGLYPFSDREQQELELRESQLVVLHALRWLLDSHRTEPGP